MTSYKSLSYVIIHFFNVFKNNIYNNKMYIFVILWIFLQVIHIYRNKYGKINNYYFQNNYK